MGNTTHERDPIRGTGYSPADEERIAEQKKAVTPGPQKTEEPQAMEDSIGEAPIMVECEALEVLYETLAPFPTAQADRMIQWVVRKLQAKNQHDLEQAKLKAIKAAEQKG